LLNVDETYLAQVQGECFEVPSIAVMAAHPKHLVDDLHGRFQRADRSTQVVESHEKLASILSIRPHVKSGVWYAYTEDTARLKKSENVSQERFPVLRLEVFEKVLGIDQPCNAIVTWQRVAQIPAKVKLRMLDSIDIEPTRHNSIPAAQMQTKLWPTLQDSSGISRAIAPSPAAQGPLQEDLAPGISW
jgi:hypothetical protein